MLLAFGVVIADGRSSRSDDDSLGADSYTENGETRGLGGALKQVILMIIVLVLAVAELMVMGSRKRRMIRSLRDDGMGG